MSEKEERYNALIWAYSIHEHCPLCPLLHKTCDRQCRDIIYFEDFWLTAYRASQVEPAKKE